jgi:2-methylcitrate dehydratase PrpD
MEGCDESGGLDALTVAEELARHALAIRYEDLPEQAIEWSEIGFLDTIGVTLAGSQESCVRILRDLPGVGKADGPCVTFGDGKRCDLLDAALINATASHALDYDDFASSIGGHPSVTLVPAILALGDSMDISGRQAICAYVAGFEAESRIGRAVNPHHYDKGWHPTATLGIFGTVIALSHLLGFDEHRAATAIAIAASMASGVKSNFGTMTKPLHIGQSVRNGMMATLLARDGFTANPETIEHKQGFLAAFQGDEAFDPSRLFENWAKPLEIVEPGFGVKQFPCCGSTHTAINCMIELREEHNLSPGDVRNVQVLVNPRRLPHTDNPDPHTGLEGKFSLPYLIARALADGDVRLGHFDDRELNEPSVRAVMAKIATAAHDDMPADSENQFGSEVTVVLTDGREFSRRIDHRLGRGPDHPMSDEELRQKFEDCAGRVCTSTQVGLLYEKLRGLRGLPKISNISNIIAVDEPVQEMTIQQESV